MRFIIIIISLLSLICAQSIEPQVAPLNPDFIKYQEDKKMGLINKINSEGYHNGIIPHPTDHKIDIPKNYKVNTSIQSQYDLRNLGLVTPVKNQGQCGSCWIFATIGSVESFWKTLGLGTYDLSENNAATENGFEGDPCEGGNAKQLTPYLIRGDGPVSEADDPYVLGKHYNPMSDPQGIVTEARFLPNDVDILKQSIMDYGGLYSSFWWFGDFDNYYNQANDTYFFSSNPDDTTDAGHAIVLVGWDDDMPTAGGTGAWIIKNSWGDGFGENGYFYISYHDAFINTGTIASWPGRIGYNSNMTVYYYDKLGYIYDWGYGNDIAYALVKYTIQNDETLFKVGTYAVRGNAEISFDIWDNFNNGQLSGPLGNTSVNNVNNCVYPGYYSYGLLNPIDVTAGNDIYIRVKYKTTGYTWPIPSEGYDEDYANPQIESNCFWISSTGNNGSWFLFGDNTDDYKNDPCVKLYTTVTSSAVEQTILDEGFDADSFPPTGWTQTITNTSNTWKKGNPSTNNFSTINPNSQFSAICMYDDNVDQEEWLYSPVFTLPTVNQNLNLAWGYVGRGGDLVGLDDVKLVSNETDGTAVLEFYSGYSTAWLSGATMSCWIWNGTNWTKIWEAENDGNPWGWRKQEIDILTYLGIDDDTTDRPNEFVLDQNYPNPFNPITTIDYYVPYDSNVKIIIYDLMGREVNTIVDDFKVIGNYRSNWNGRNDISQIVSGGIYFYKLQAGDFIQTRKMVFLK